MAKKKIKDLTLKEIKAICDRHFEKYKEHCCDTECPIFKLGFNFCPLYLEDKEKCLESEIEVMSFSGTRTSGKSESMLNAMKEHDALEIIITKDIDVGTFKKLVFGRIPLTDKEKLDYWNDTHNNKITMEEYDLLYDLLKELLS